MVGKAGLSFEPAQKGQNSQRQQRQRYVSEGAFRFVFHTVGTYDRTKRFSCQALVFNGPGTGPCKRAQRRQDSVMPSLDTATPEVTPKSLRAREGRTGTILAISRATLPAQMVLRLRRMAADLGDLACDGSAPAEDRIAAAKAVVSVQDQLIDLLGIPRRPAAGNGKRPSAPMLDVSPGVAAPPDLPA